MSYVTTRQVADALHMDVSTIIRWCQSGDLPCLQLPGGQYRIDSDVLEGWVEARRNGPRGTYDAAAHARACGAGDLHGAELEAWWARMADPPPPHDCQAEMARTGTWCW